jgi:lysophospholipase L1-like esterase
MKRLRSIVWYVAILPAVILAVLTPWTHAEGTFYLKNGDRVVFYGDSITDQRLYTTFAESYVVTRFPKLDVTFVHSGWGGDRVSGGGGGPIDLRLSRDVFAYNPTVMTIMLGMNDASYRGFDDAIFATYSKGYEHIVDSVKSHIPGIRMTLIQPSPFDDVTRPPAFPGGYNFVLIRYGHFVKDLAKTKGLDVADLNTDLVEATKRAAARDKASASKLNQDRVHPGPAGQLLMAASLLKAWNAPALVSEVKIKVSGQQAESEQKGADVSDLKINDGSMRWSQIDQALPFPLDLKNPLIELAQQSSDFVEALDKQTLKVEGLPQGGYRLSIDGELLGTFTRSQLEVGINLALLPTPMLKQAAAVHKLTLKHNDLHFFRWRQVQVPLQKDYPDKLEKILSSFDELEAGVVEKQRALAQPKPHRFELNRAQ